MKTSGSFFSARTTIGPSIARGVVKGAVIGLGLAVALFAAALAVELLNCFTGGYFQKMPIGSFLEPQENLLHAGWAGAVGIFRIWSWRAFFEVASFFGIASCPIGAVYAFALQKQMGSTGKSEQKSAEQ